MAYRDTSAPWLRTRSNQYTRGIRSRVMEVHSGGFEKRRTCHLAAAPLIIMRRAYLPSDDGGPTWRWARCAYSYFLFRRLLTGDSTDGTSAIVPPSRRTCPASFFDDAQRGSERGKNSSRDEYTKIEILQITNRKEWYPKCRGIFYLSFASLTDLKKYTRKWSVLVNIIYIKMHQKKSLFQKRSCITRFEIKYDYRCEPFL